MVIIHIYCQLINQTGATKKENNEFCIWKVSDLYNLEKEKSKAHLKYFEYENGEVLKMPNAILKLNIKNKNILIFDIIYPSEDTEKIMVFYDNDILEFYECSKNEYMLYFQYKLPIYHLLSFTYNMHYLYILEETSDFPHLLIRFNFKSNLNILYTFHLYDELY